MNTLVDQLHESNNRVRTLIAERNDERSEQVLGELASARKMSDAAYAAVVLYTNAYALLCCGVGSADNTDRREAADLVRRMQEDLEYFRQHAMTNPNRNRTSGGDAESISQPADEDSNIAE